MTPKTKSAISTAAFTILVILLMVFVSGYTFDENEYLKDNPPKIPPEGFEVSLGEPDRGQGESPAPSAKETSSSSTQSASQSSTTPTQSKGPGQVKTSDQNVDNHTTTSNYDGPDAKKTADDAWHRINNDKNNSNNNGQGSGLGETDIQGNQGSKDGNSGSLNPQGNDKGGMDGIAGGRHLCYKPYDTYSSDNAGKVVITLRVMVDKKGNVTRAELQRASIHDAKLIDKAKSLALKARFFPGAANDPEEQSGTITVTFKNTK